MAKRFEQNEKVYKLFKFLSQFSISIACLNQIVFLVILSSIQEYCNELQVFP